MVIKKLCKIYLGHFGVPSDIIWWLIQLILLANALVISPAHTQWTQVEHPDSLNASEIDNYPKLYKCCPLHQKYENGDCVDLGETEVHNGILHWRPPEPFFAHRNSAEFSDDPPVFRLIPGKRPNCSSGVVEKIIMLQRIVETPSDHVEVAEEDSQSDVILSSQGYLVWTDEFKFANYVSNFCLDRINSTAYVAVMCKRTCSAANPCIRKCCPPDFVADDTKSPVECVRVKGAWKPLLYDLKVNDSLELIQDTTDMEIKRHYQVGVPACREMYPINLRNETDGTFHLLRDGTLMTVQDSSRSLHSPDTFCVDGVIHFSQDEFATTEYPFYGTERPEFGGTERDQVAIICYPEFGESSEPPPFIIYATTEYISSFFLILTAIVYLILWEYQNIHGWLQFSYVISLLFAYTFLASAQMFATFIHNESKEVCEYVGASILFFFLSAFFWLTSMNFDLWWTFSGCRPLRASTRTGEKKRFAIFALLSWGGSVLITAAAVLMDRLYGEDPLFRDYLPRFGQTKCYFSDEKSKLPFFYAPVGIVLFVNTVFFLSTIISLHKLQKDTKFATKQSSKQDKKRFLLFMKLFVVMGVCWIFEFISSLLLLFVPEKQAFWNSLFLPTDVINGLQGFFIFLIFTCKPNTCKQLEGQFKKSSKRLEENRDKTVGNAAKAALPRWIMVGFCTVALVAVRGFSKLFNFCGRTKRSFTRRNHPNNTVSSSFEKSRKASDSSACTTLSIVYPGAIEMDATY